MADLLRLRAAAKRLPEEDAEHLRSLILEAKRQAVALANIRKSVGRLDDAVRRGVYGSRSIVGDEVLNMLEEFERLG